MLSSWISARIPHQSKIKDFCQLPPGGSVWADNIRPNEVSDLQAQSVNTVGAPVPGCPNPAIGGHPGRGVPTMHFSTGRTAPGGSVLLSRPINS